MARHISYINLKVKPIALELLEKKNNNSWRQVLEFICQISFTYILAIHVKEQKVGLARAKNLSSSSARDLTNQTLNEPSLVIY